MTGKGPPQPVVAALLSSGFPFQTAVTGAVRKSENWKVLAEEFPWREDSTSDHFLDVVVSNGLFTVCIECKKTQKETFTFLLPEGSAGKAARARLLYLQQIQDSTKRMELFCADRFVAPISAESQFCIVSTSDSGKDQRLLERDAQRLVRGTDAYAVSYQRDFKAKVEPEADRLIVPVLVTNAKIFVAKYDSADVSLETGQFAEVLNADIEPVEQLRFRKSFTTNGSRDLGPRTIFVVSAVRLLDFLDDLSVTDTTVIGKIGFKIAGTA